MDRRDPGMSGSHGEGFAPCPERMRNRMSRGPMRGGALSMVTERTENVDPIHSQIADRRATIRERSSGPANLMRDKSRGPAQALSQARPPHTPQMSGAMPPRAPMAPMPMMAPHPPPHQMSRPPPAHPRSRRPSVTLPEDHYVNPESESEYSSNLSAETQATSAPSEGPAKPYLKRRVLRVQPATLRNRSVLHASKTSRGSARSRVSAPASHPSHRTIRIQVHPLPRGAVSNLSRPPSEAPNVEGFKDEIQRLKNEAKLLQDRSHFSQKELEGALDRLSSMTLQRVEAQKERDMERRWRDNLHHDFEQRGQVIETLRHRLDERDRALIDVGDKLQDRTRKMEEMRVELDTRGQTLDQLKTQLDEQGQKIEELNGKISDNEKAAEELGKEKDAIRTVKEELEAQCAQLQEDLTAAEMKSGQEEVLIETVAALELTRDGLQSQVSSLESQRGLAEMEIADLTKARDNLQAESDRYAAEAKALEAEKAALEGEKENLTAKVGDLEGENQELKTKVEGLEGEKVEHEGQIASLTTERDELKTKTEEQDTELGNLREAEAAATAEVAKLQGENATLQADGDALRENLKKTTEELEETTQRAEEQTERANKLDAEVKDLASQLDGANTRLKNLNEAHMNALGEITELKIDVKTWKKKARTRPKQEDFVVVRDPQNRANLQVMKKTELRRSRSRPDSRSRSKSGSDEKSITSSDSE